MAETLQNLLLYGGCTLIGALILAVGYRAGVEKGRIERDDSTMDTALRGFDPDDTAGRLPSDVDTDQFPAIPPLGSDEWVELEQATRMVGESSGRHWRQPGEPLPPWLSMPGTERYTPAGVS